MSCTAQAEVETPPEVETMPFEKASGAAEDEYDQAERLQAQRTAAEEAETAAAAAALALETLERGTALGSIEALGQFSDRGSQCAFLLIMLTLVAFGLFILNEEIGVRGLPPLPYTYKMPAAACVRCLCSAYTELPAPSAQYLCHRYPTYIPSCI